MVIYQVNKQKSYAQVNIKRMPKETIIIIIIIISSKYLRPINHEDQSIRHMPKDFLRNSNLRESRGLLRISVN